MRRWPFVLLVPVLATAVLASTQPAQALSSKKPSPKPSPFHGGKGGDKPIKGGGPSKPPPFDDGGTAGQQGPRVTVAPDGTSEVDVRVGAWAQVPGLPVMVRGKAGGPSRVRVTVSSGPDVQDQGGELALLVERTDGVTTPAPVQVALETADLSGVFRANWVHRLHVTTASACVALQHPHVNRGKHKGHAYAYGLRRRCAAPAPADGADVLVVDDSDDAEVIFDATSGEEVNEELPSDASADGAGGGGRIPGASAPMPLVRPTVGTSTAVSLAYVVGAGPSGSAGSFSATPLASASKWQVGEQSGDFSTSYTVPVPAPPVAAAWLAVALIPFLPNTGSAGVTTLSGVVAAASTHNDPPSDLSLGSGTPADTATTTRGAARLALAAGWGLAVTQNGLAVPHGRPAVMPTTTSSAAEGGSTWRSHRIAVCRTSRSESTWQGCEMRDMRFPRQHVCQARYVAPTAASTRCRVAATSFISRTPFRLSS